LDQPKEWDDPCRFFRWYYTSTLIAFMHSSLLLDEMRPAQLALVMFQRSIAKLSSSTVNSGDSPDEARRRMDQVMHRKFHLAECAIAFLVLWCVVGTAHANSYIWTNSTSGSFSNPLNWSPNQVPSAGDDVNFENDYTVSMHTIAFDGQTTASTMAESDLITTVFQLDGNYDTGSFTLNSAGGLVELTGGGTMTAQSLYSLDLLISDASLVVASTAAPNSCTVDGSSSTFQCGSLSSASFIVTNEGTAICESIPETGGSIIYVDGLGSTLTIIGSAASFQFYITGGGIVRATTFSGSLLTVDGGGSQMQLSGTFSPPGAGYLTQLTVTNGGEFACPGVRITNSLYGFVSGQDSQWNTVGRLYLGTHALLTVQDGGQVTANTMGIDSYPLQVQGTNSLLSAQSITVGEFGDIPASIEISQGAEVQSQTGIVGDNPFGSARVLVQDPGSLLLLNGALTVGGGRGSGGPGFLTVTNGGLAQINSNLTILPSGTVTLNGGSVNIGQAISVPAPNVLRISAGGTLANTGAVYGKIQNAGGLMTAGNTDGTSTIIGDYEQDAGGQLLLNLSGTNQSSGYDVLHVTGNISLAGTLTLNCINGFAPKTGQTFALIQYGGTPTGNFDQIQLNGLAPGFEYQLQQAAGGLSLVAQNDGVATSPPLLSLTPAGNELMISWPDTAPGYNLQSSTNLNSTNWTTLTTTSNQFATPAAGAMQFFRLVKPGT
jgi:subtilase-type serine protease